LETVKGKTGSISSGLRMVVSDDYALAR